MSSTLPFVAKKSPKALPITLLTEKEYDGWLKKQDKATKNWLTATGFKGKPGGLAVIPGKNGAPQRILATLPEKGSLYDIADLSGRLPREPGEYYIDAKLSPDRATDLALGFALGVYKFSDFKSKKNNDAPARLVWPAGADRDFVQSAVDAVFLVRDLVNTPANHMGPAELEKAGKTLAGTFNGASVSVISGKDLLKKNYPAIYEVGKGSPRDPRLIDIRWGKKGAPKVTLVGKGVCFDTGGLDIKDSSSMLLMKKDMGGAAHVLGLARMIMDAELPVQLRVLIPAVENAVDGSSYRPSDIIKTRKGLTVEVGNTDAEGRIILADALAEACRDKPDLLIDFATLTGAARTALGPDLPAMFCNDDHLAEAFLKSSKKVSDPVWRLPLWSPYASWLDSPVADTNNVGGSFAGAITAALFLQKFVDEKTPWIHLDTYAWNTGNRPGRPSGGEALGMRAGFDLIESKFGKKKAPHKKP